MLVNLTQNVKIAKKTESDGKTPKNRKSILDIHLWMLMVMIICVRNFRYYLRTKPQVFA